MKFNQYIWNIYKNSEEGRKSITIFDNTGLYGANILNEYYPHSLEILQSKEVFIDVVELIYCYTVSDLTKPSNIEEAKELFDLILNSGISGDSGDKAINPEEHNIMLGCLSHISFALFVHSKDYFFPYLFLFDFYTLKKIFDLFDIELPPIPQKRDYNGRCLYYMSLCEVLHNFRINNDLSPSELCAFLYDFSPNLLDKRIENVNKSVQAWFIGGKKNKKEMNLNNVFWQADEETLKGDIMIMYEKSPISAITSIWISLTDGIIDPFFYYYSNTYIGNKIDIPNITLEELKNNSYFSKHPLVRKNFQGVNGWTITSFDYEELKKILNNKDFDTSTLPSLYTPSRVKHDTIKNERDVEINLIEPLLSELGLEYIRQVPLKAGRGHRIFPDYAICYDQKKGTAKIIIEAKYYLKSNRDIEDCFSQAKSYANLLESSMLVIGDMNFIMIYEKKDSFDRNRYIKYYWEELKNADVFQSLKKLFKF